MLLVLVYMLYLAIHEWLDENRKYKREVQLRERVRGTPDQCRDRRFKN